MQAHGIAERCLHERGVRSWKTHPPPRSPENGANLRALDDQSVSLNLLALLAQQFAQCLAGAVTSADRIDLHGMAPTEVAFPQGADERGHASPSSDDRVMDRRGFHRGLIDAMQTSCWPAPFVKIRNPTHFPCEDNASR